MNNSQPMPISRAIAKVINRLDLNEAEMHSVIEQIMSGTVSEAQIGGILVALRMKSESIDEIVGAATAMRSLSTRVKIAKRQHLVDIVGTGGDGANLFNVSSASAFVAAAAGAVVAKHGNRAVSSKSGSADLLEKAGVDLNLSCAQVEKCIAKLGIGFLYAPVHHGAMRHVIGARNALGQRTIFNILGPMTNPADVKKLVVGVFNRRLCKPMAESMARLGAEHVMVVHGKEGLDEISLASETYVCEYVNQEIKQYQISAEDAGIDSQSLQGLSVANSSESLAIILAAFGAENTTISAKIAKKAQLMIALNAGAAIYVSGIATSWKEGVAMAKKELENKRALELLRQLGAYSNSLSKQN